MSEFLGPNTKIPINRAAGLRQADERIQNAIAQAQALFQKQQMEAEDAEAMKHPLLRRALGMMSDPVQSISRQPPVGPQSPAVMDDAQTYLRGLGFSPTLGGAGAQQPASSSSPVGPSAGGGSSLPTSSPAIRSSSPQGLPTSALSPRQSGGYTEPATGIRHPFADYETTVKARPEPEPPLTPAVMRMLTKFAPYLAQVKAAQVGSQGRYDNTELAKIMEAQANRVNASVKLALGKANYDAELRNITARAASAKSSSDMLKAWIAALNIKAKTAQTVKDYHAASSEDHPDAAAARAQANEAAQLELQLRERAQKAMGIRSEQATTDPEEALKSIAKTSPELADHLRKFPTSQWKQETEAFLGD